RGCLTLAATLDGAVVETIEGVSDSGEIRDLQDAFIARNACQCGYCTPGMLLTAAQLLKDNPRPTREEIRHYLAGNYCRCTRYQPSVEAVEAPAARRRARRCRPSGRLTPISTPASRCRGPTPRRWSRAAPATSTM